MIFIRATNQWFTDLGKVKESALKALESVEFHPPSSEALNPNLRTFNLLKYLV
jgi:isoleucyl-tRNA synthetase